MYSEAESNTSEIDDLKAENTCLKQTIDILSGQCLALLSELNDMIPCQMLRSDDHGNGHQGLWRQVAKDEWQKNTRALFCQLIARHKLADRPQLSNIAFALGQ